jgi:hypothetical protein
MRITVIAIGLTLVAVSPVAAQGAESKPTSGTRAAAGPPVAPPRLFQAAGYAQPDITPGLCQTVSPQEVRCTIPQMTAGRYQIIASGASTATGADAVQAIDIRLDTGGEEFVCAKGQSQTPKDGKPWSEGAQTIRIGCIAQIVADNGMTVRATYADAHAKADPRGPLLVFRKMPWNPIVEASQVIFQPPPAAAAK